MTKNKIERTEKLHIMKIEFCLKDQAKEEIY